MVPFLVFINLSLLVIINIKAYIIEAKEFAIAVICAQRILLSNAFKSPPVLYTIAVIIHTACPIGYHAIFPKFSSLNFYIIGFIELLFL